MTSMACYVDVTRRVTAHAVERAQPQGGSGSGEENAVRFMFEDDPTARSVAGSINNANRGWRATVRPVQEPATSQTFRDQIVEALVATEILDPDQTTTLKEGPDKKRAG